MRLGTKRLLADHGMCVVVGYEKLATVKQGVSMKGFGVEQTLEYPEPWNPYFYCSAERRFRPLAALIADGKVVKAGSPLPKEEPVIEVAEQKKITRWPALSGAVSEANPVRISNPNSYSVKVALRSGTDGKDFSVAANDTTTVHVRDGRYDIYFQYSDDPNGLYQGDSFTLSGNGVEIQLVKVVGGNYGIRKIK